MNKPGVKSGLILGQRGFSLIEMMIAITISLIILVAIGYLYIGSRQAFRGTEAMSRIQENARYALQSMAQNVRMAGYVGCVNLASQTVYPIPPAAAAPAPALTAGNVISGTDAGAGAATIGGITRVAGDTLTVFGAFSDPVSVVGSAAGGTVPINGNPFGFKNGDVLVVTNCSRVNAFTVASFSPAAAFTPPGTTVTFTPVVNLTGAYAADSFVIKMDQYTYFIGSNPSGGRSLYRDSLNDGTVELADNVWDMQVQYGYDANVPPVGAANIYFSAGNVPDWTRVVSARISLLMVSPENTLSVPQTYQFFGNTATALSAMTPIAADPDRLRLHQVFTTTVGLRNRLP